MGQDIKTSVADMVAAANEQVTCLGVTQAHDLLASPDHVFVDLRDFRELKRTGKISDAFSCPRGMLEFWIDPQSPYHKEIFAQDKTYVFYCASGWRSALATKAAADMGLAPVAHILGGITEWIKQGLPVEQIDS
jgi:rhodanese-related sulfurtransferase